MMGDKIEDLTQKNHNDKILSEHKKRVGKKTEIKSWKFRIRL